MNDYRFSLKTDDNLYNYRLAISGRKLDHNGQIVLDSNYLVSDFIKVKDTRTYYSPKVFEVFYFDKDKNFITYTDFDGISPTWVVNENCYYMRFNVKREDRTTFAINAVYDVYPYYSKDLSIEVEKESANEFFRNKLSSSLTFVDRDFDTINNASFNAEFELKILQGWQTIFKGSFFKTDCTFNLDKRTIVAKIGTKDNYDAILGGLEKEFNLIELAPELQEITYSKRPLVQVYIAGESVISNFLSGMTWEQDVNVVTSDRNKLVRDYKFALANRLFELDFVANEDSKFKDATGIYSGRLSWKLADKDTFEATLYAQDNQPYYAKISQDGHTRTTYIDIFKDSDKKVVFSAVAFGTADTKRYDFKPAGLENNSGGSGYLYNYYAYLRLLLDIEKFPDGQDTYPIGTNDIVDNNRNYKRVIGLAMDSVIISGLKSVEPTKWGMAEDGRYFDKPTSMDLSDYFAVGQSKWRKTSIWYYFDTLYEYFEIDGRKKQTLRNAYRLGSCLKVLLREVAPNIRHELTEEYSKFLYANMNPISYRKFELFLTPKSNIIVGDYKEPASREMVTLGQLLNMLRDCFKVYWYIEDGKFKLEHINYFNNGMSYTSNNKVQLDLTKIRDSKNKHLLSYYTNEYSFDKIDMPERYQFAWMDEVTEVFKGFPIVVKDKHVQLGKIEDINVGRFTTDLDYILLNPDSVSKEGFMMLATATNNEFKQEVIFYEDRIFGQKYSLQNGLLSFAFLQPNYYTYDLPSYDVEINGKQSLIHGITKLKKQQISLPVDFDIDTNRLIRTKLGDANVDKISIPLESNYAKVTLKYNTYEY